MKRRLLINENNNVETKIQTILVLGQGLGIFKSTYNKI